MGCYPDLYNYLLGHRYHIMRTLAFIAALIGVSLDVSGQPFRLPDPPTPEHAYEQLLAVRCFAFGGVGYAGVTSGGEIAYRAIAGSTNAVALFLKGVKPEWRLDKVTSFSYICCGAAFLSSDDEAD